MQKRRALIGGLLILIICEMAISTTAIGITIIIDGDFTDWEGLEPVFTEEELHPDYWLDIQQAFIAANETMLFVRVDYAAQLDDWASLMTNITLQTPSNEVFILMYQIIYDSIPNWSFTAVFGPVTTDRNPGTGTGARSYCGIVGFGACACDAETFAFLTTALSVHLAFL